MIDRLRIGLGIDLHRLAPGRPCVLGGVRIDAPAGPVAVSDGDAVLHAACDAVLGAAGQDDLGTLFPERDPRNAGRDSREFCAEVRRRLDALGARVLSLDVVVETEAPRLKPHREAIRTSLGAQFGIDAARVNVKGKTAEQLDAIGRGEALRATVVALVLLPPPAGGA